MQYLLSDLSDSLPGVLPVLREICGHEPSDVFYDTVRHELMEIS